MAQQTINIGSAPNDGTGDTLRAAGDKINDNFDELYAADAALGTAAALDVDTDDTLAADSDSLIPTQQAVKGYVDAAVAGGGGASTTQTTEMMAGFIAAPANKDYRIVVKMAHGGTITETTTISVSGTCTATFKINTTALGGTANSVSSSEQSQAHASANAFSAGDDIVLTVSSNSSCADMSFSIKYTRTLE